ncbi:hypothetical protein BKA80DRAFT_283662 [Phyllosticta citrichinensis]
MTPHLFLGHPFCRCKEISSHENQSAECVCKRITDVTTASTSVEKLKQTIIDHSFRAWRSFTLALALICCRQILFCGTKKQTEATLSSPNHPGPTTVEAMNTSVLHSTVSGTKKALAAPQAGTPGQMGIPKPLRGDQARLWHSGDGTSRIKQVQFRKASCVPEASKGWLEQPVAAQADDVRKRILTVAVRPQDDHTLQDG